MKESYIYCRVLEKGEQSFFLCFENKSYFLFSQNYRKTNQIIFRTKVYLSELRKLKKNKSYSVRRVIEKLPTYFRIIEQQKGIKIMNKNKNNFYKREKYSDIDYLLEMSA